MLSLYSMPVFLVAIAVTMLGIFVYFRDKTAGPNRSLFLLCLNIAVWLYCYSVAYSVTDEKLALFWARNSYLGIIFIPVTIFQFTVNLLGLKRKKLLRFLYFLGLCFLVLSRTDYFFSGVKRWFWGFYPFASYLYHPFLVFFFGTYSASLLLLFSHMRKNIYTDKKKLQLAYVFWALVVASLASVDYLGKYGISIYPFGYINMVLFVSILAYAIIKHQLLNIEIIIKKTLVFAGLLASVFAMLVLPTLLIQEYIFRSAGFGGRLLGLTISGIIIILALRRVENFLVNATDKYLFQKKYDYKKLLKTFTSEVLTVLDLSRLLNLTVDKLSAIIKLQSASILLLDEEKNEYRLVASHGVKEKDVVMRSDNTLTSFLIRTKSYLSVKALEKDYKLPEKIVRDMNRLNLELAIPLITLQEEMIGILTLGKKKSDDDYTQDDMDILLPLARTLAIAISNAEMFDELGKTQAEAAQKEKMAVIGTLSAGINHEICNPLGIARGQCEAFLLNVKDGLYKNKSHDELFKKAQKIMEKVIHETDRATAITKRLSSFAKPSKGIISNDISIKDEIDEVLALVGYELKLDKIDISQEIDKNLPSISGDKKQLQEVFFNLIRNAAQAIKEKGKIVVSAKEKNGTIRIEIEDTGHGIPEDKLGRIFDPFYTTKEPGKGTGLGLFIVRQVVERNKGRISVRSKVNKGTIFILEFPVATKESVA